MARERIFEPLSMTRSSFFFDSEMRSNYSLGHDRAGGPDKWQVNLALASSTLHTTASDLAKFGTHLAAQIRSDGPYAALATPAVTIEDVDGVERSWGPGLGVVTEGAHRYVYHTGNNVIFIADFMYGVEENFGYALLTNSSQGQQIADAVELRFFGHRIRE